VNINKRRSISSREFLILFLIVIAVLIAGAILIYADISISHSIPGGGGFLVNWGGARAYLFEHTEPYNPSISRAIQQLIYGRLASNGENPYYQTVPFYLLPFYFPFALISDRTMARGIWMFVNEVSLVGISLLGFLAIGWRPHRLVLIFYCLFSIFNLYSVSALLDGGPIILIGLLYMGVLYAYLIGQDELTGMLLGLTLFNWEVGFLFLFLVFWKVIHDKRWRVFYGFAMTIIILVTFSILMYPKWIFPFVVVTLANIQAQFGLNTTIVFFTLVPIYGLTIARVMTLLGIVVFTFEGVAATRSDNRQFLWTAYLTLAIIPFLGFRTELGNFVVLLPSLALVMASSADRWRIGSWFSSMLFISVLVIPWFLYSRWLSLNNQDFRYYIFLFYPLFTIISLYWMRWWFTRPPRTWIEHARSAI
jgi:hypothetical protein